MSDETKLQEKEAKLRAKAEKLEALERELKEREKAVKAAKAKEAKRKQIVLRLPESLWQDIARWADEDFRSINGQIEFLLTEAVRQRKGR